MTRFGRIALLVLAGVLCCAAEAAAQARLRKAALGDTLKPFTLDRAGGGRFEYRHEPGHAAVVVFLAAYQKRSERALRDLNDVLSRLGGDRNRPDLMVVAGGGEGVEDLRLLLSSLQIDAPLLVDQDDELWGELGVIVTPTVIACDRDGKICWIHAGHAYDFAWQAEKELRHAVGLPAREEDAAESVEVRTLPDDDARDRVRRHVRLGELLFERGRIDAAITELRKADEILPGDPEVRLALGEALCRAGKAEEALDLVGRITAEDDLERARVLALSGWARRKLGQDGTALELLERAVRLDPSSARAFYELGKVRQSRGETEQALEAYRRALALKFAEPPDS